MIISIPKTIWLFFECFGKGEEKVWEYETERLEKPLRLVIGKFGISFSEFKKVINQNNPIDFNKTIKELKIVNGTNIIIKFK